MMYLYKGTINVNIGMSFLLNVSDILNYAGEGCRKIFVGKNIVNSNHLMYCSITYECDEETTLIFLCVKSSDLFGSSHEIKWLSLKIQINIKK